MLVFQQGGSNIRYLTASPKLHRGSLRFQEVICGYECRSHFVLVEAQRSDMFGKHCWISNWKNKRSIRRTFVITFRYYNRKNSERHGNTSLKTFFTVDDTHWHETTSRKHQFSWALHFLVYYKRWPSTCRQLKALYQVTIFSSLEGVLWFSSRFVGVEIVITR